MEFCSDWIEIKRGVAESSYREEETKFTDSSGRASSGGQGDNSLARRIE